jgi:general secretion pathway protein E/type IV pilus assembly protein PilB
VRVYEQAAGSVRVGQALVRLGHASEQQVLEALDEQRRTGERLGEILVSRGVITRRQLYEALAYSLGVPFVDIANSPPDPESIRRLPAWMVRSRRILPLRESGGTLQLGMCDPRDQDAILEAEAYCKLRVQPCLIDEREFDRLAASLVDVPQAADTAGQLDQAALVVATDRPGPGGSVVEQVLEVAVRLGATDLHLSPTRSGYSVDVRVDGQLRNIARLDPETGQMAASRLKVLAGLDVAEKVRPQDGHFDAHVFGRDVDVRVASLGTPLGEKVSCRLLGRRSALVGLDRLGMTPQQAEAVRSVLRGGRGMLLFCGPVGSGKTTSMFACVAELERQPLLIVSVEDPVEYSMERVVQIAVQEKAGLTFPEALRAILRHDPDVVVVGEIRDAETARTATNAALAGRLVLATMHSRSPQAAVVRMVDMGVEPHVLTSALDVVVGCSLVRTLCSSCSGRGCITCGDTGYSGRTGVFELMVMTRASRDAVLRRADADSVARSAAWIPEGGAWAAGQGKVDAGITTPAELERALGMGRPATGRELEVRGDVVERLSAL